MWMDGQVDMRKLIVAFRNSVNASKNWNQKVSRNVLPLQYSSNLVNIISDYQKSIQP